VGIYRGFHSGEGLHPRPGATAWAQAGSVLPDRASVLMGPRELSLNSYWQYTSVVRPLGIPSAEIGGGPGVNSKWSPGMCPPPSSSRAESPNPTKPPSGPLFWCARGAYPSQALHLRERGW